MRLLFLLPTALLLFARTLRAQEEAAVDSSELARAAFESQFTFQQGDIVLGEGLATLHVPDGYRYLDPEQSERLLVEGWGNPPGNETLGMLFRSDVGLLSADGWGVVITYIDDGHVKDDDASEIDYAKLLREMQASTREESKARVAEGYESIRLVGWAARPHYDSVAKKLYWAKELQFGATEGNVLNYDIRVLGRGGVLSLNAVASMDVFPSVEQGMAEVPTFIEFNEGHRYADYVAGDKVAAYGIGALVAGKLAAKAGLFKVLLAGLLAFKKGLVVLVIAAGGLLKKFLGRKEARAV